MTQSAVGKLIKRDVRAHVVGECVKIGLLPIGAAAFAGMLFGALLGVGGTHGAAALAIASAPVGAWLAWRTWKQGEIVLQARYALLINRWVDAAPDPAETRRRRAVYAARGIAGALPHIEAGFARTVRVQLAAKARLHEVTRRKLAQRDDTSDDDLQWLRAHPGTPGCSGNGLPLGETGLDCFGDGPGSTVMHDGLYGGQRAHTEP